MESTAVRPVPPGLDVRSEARGTSLTITAAGEIDLATVERLDAALSGALRLVPEIVVIDLGAVTFVDSTAVHWLLVAHRRAVAHGIRLAIIPGPEAVQRTFGLCGILDVLPFAATLSPAGVRWTA